MPLTIHPTKQALIDTVANMLQTQEPEQLTTEAVLEASGVSRSSMYHHFEDFHHLVEYALVQRFAAYVDDSIEKLTAAITGAPTQSDLRVALQAVTRATQDPALRKVRAHRVSAIALASTNERFGTLLAGEQERLTEAITDLIREVQSKSFVTQDLDPRAGAVLIQAYTIGKIIDDYTEKHVDPQKWNSMIDMVMDRVFGLAYDNTVEHIPN